MKKSLITSTLIIIALATIVVTLLHGSLSDVSIFHGLILHPMLLIAGISLFAFAKIKHRDTL